MDHDTAEWRCFFNEELSELRRLAALADFDLRKFLHKIGDLGTPLVTSEIDDEATKAAGRVVVVYHLSQDLLNLLSTLRILTGDGVVVGVGPGRLEVELSQGEGDAT